MFWPWNLSGKPNTPSGSGGPFEFRGVTRAFGLPSFFGFYTFLAAITFLTAYFIFFGGALAFGGGNFLAYGRYYGLAVGGGLTSAFAGVGVGVYL